MKAKYIFLVSGRSWKCPMARDLQPCSNHKIRGIYVSRYFLWILRNKSKTGNKVGGGTHQKGLFKYLLGCERWLAFSRNFVRLRPTSSQWYWVAGSIPVFAILFSSMTQYLTIYDNSKLVFMKFYEKIMFLIKQYVNILESVPKTGAKKSCTHRLDPCA